MEAKLSVSDGLLVGHIYSSYGNLIGTIANVVNLRGSMSMPIGYSDYTGDYEVTPKIVAQSLPTADKHLSKDVVIKEIPYYEVSNQANGKTIIIGG